jgi:hypothetical protein
MEYAENKNQSAMLLKLACLYVELDAYQGALAVCTLILETSTHSFKHMNEAVFLAALVARQMHQLTQSGDYLAHLVDAPPHCLRSYQLLLLAGIIYI